MQVRKDTLKEVLFSSPYACKLHCQSKIVLLKVLTFTAAGQLFSQKKEYIYIIYIERVAKACDNLLQPYFVI
jgi:hypothetical protein